MASSTATNYQHQKSTEFLLLGAPWTPPTTLYVGMFTTTPTLAGTGGVEVNTTGTGYARQAIPCNNTGFQGPSGANLTYSNKNDISFAVPTANWGSITGAGLFDSPTGGNLMFVAVLTTSKVVNNGDGAPRILAGQLQFSRATC